MDTSLRATLASARASDELMAYIEARSILSVEVYAELGEDLKGFDQAMVEPLASPFKLPDGKVFEVTGTDMSVVRARLRHAWKKARDREAGPQRGARVDVFGICLHAVYCDQGKRASSWFLASTSSQIRGSHDPRRTEEIPRTHLARSGGHPSQAAERLEEPLSQRDSARRNSA